MNQVSLLTRLPRDLVGQILLRSWSSRNHLRLILVCKLFHAIVHDKNFLLAVAPFMQYIPSTHVAELISDSFKPELTVFYNTAVRIQNFYYTPPQSLMPTEIKISERTPKSILLLITCLSEIKERREVLDQPTKRLYVQVYMLKSGGLKFRNFAQNVNLNFVDLISQIDDRDTREYLPEHPDKFSSDEYAEFYLARSLRNLNMGWTLKDLDGLSSILKKKWNRYGKELLSKIVKIASNDVVTFVADLAMEDQSLSIDSLPRWVLEMVSNEAFVHRLAKELKCSNLQRCELIRRNLMFPFLLSNVTDINEALAAGNELDNYFRFWMDHPKLITCDASSVFESCKEKYEMRDAKLPDSQKKKIGAALCRVILEKREKRAVLAKFFASFAYMIVKTIKECPEKLDYSKCRSSPSSKEKFECVKIMLPLMKDIEIEKLRNSVNCHHCRGELTKSLIAAT